MEKTKLIIIGIRGSSKEELHNLQTELFKLGYTWSKSGKEYQNIYSFDEPIVLTNNLIYTVKEENIEYLSEDDNVESIRISDIVTYFRFLKLKQLNKV